jgi:hypothetical protein
MPFKIPPDLAGDLANTLVRESDRPVVREFCTLAIAGVPWHPGWSRLLLRLAAGLEVPVTGLDRVFLLTTGFRGGDRPRRIRRAIAVILREWRQRGQYIYRDGRDLLVLDSGEPRRRYGAPESLLRPIQYPSPMGPMPTPEASSPAPAPMPHPPAPPPPAVPTAPAAMPYLTRRG